MTTSRVAAIAFAYFSIAFPFAVAHAQTYDADFGHPAYSGATTPFSGSACADFREGWTSLTNGPFAPGNPTVPIHGQAGFQGWVDETSYRVREDSSDRIPLTWFCNAWPWDWPTEKYSSAVVETYVDTTGLGPNTFIPFTFSWKAESVHELYATTAFGWFTGDCKLEIPSLSVVDVVAVDPTTGTCDFGPYWIQQDTIRLTAWAQAGVAGTPAEAVAATMNAGLPIRSSFTIDVSGHETTFGAEL